MNYLRMLKLILAINKIPLLNRILNVSQIKIQVIRIRRIYVIENVKYAEENKLFKKNLMSYKLFSFRI